MATYLMNLILNWDQKIYQKRTMQAVRIAMKQTLPILAIDVYLRLIFKLFFSPDSLFANVFNVHLSFFHSIAHPTQSQFTLSILDTIVVMVYVTSLTHSFLTVRNVKHVIVPILTNVVATYFLLVEKYQIPDHSTMQYLLLTGVTLFSSQSYNWYQKRMNPNVQPYAIRYLLWSGFIIMLCVSAHPIVQQSNIQIWLSEILYQPFFTSFVGLLLVALLTPILFVLGLRLPTELMSDQTTLNVVVLNLDTMLSHANVLLPFPENLYSTYGAFSLFGGIGNSLVISILLLFAHSKRHRQLGVISWFPSLFNNNQLLYNGLPMFLRPLILIPMILVSIMSITISYLAIALHLMAPPVFMTPVGMPTILTPTLASNSHLSAIIVTIIIFGLSILIYKPFIKQLTMEELNEK